MDVRWARSRGPGRASPQQQYMGYTTEQGTSLQARVPRDAWISSSSTLQHNELDQQQARPYGTASEQVACSSSGRSQQRWQSLPQGRRIARLAGIMPQSRRAGVPVAASKPAPPRPSDEPAPLSTGSANSSHSATHPQLHSASRRRALRLASMRRQATSCGHMQPASAAAQGAILAAHAGQNPSSATPLTAKPCAQPPHLPVHLRLLNQQRPVVFIANIWRDEGKQSVGDVTAHPACSLSQAPATTPIPQTVSTPAHAPSSQLAPLGEQARHVSRRAATATPTPTPTDAAPLQCDDRSDDKPQHAVWVCVRQEHSLNSCPADVYVLPPTRYVPEADHAGELPSHMSWFVKIGWIDLYACCCGGMAMDVPDIGMETEVC